jgi:hypothetical protein
MQAETVTGRQQALAVERRYQVRMGAFKCQDRLKIDPFLPVEN